MCDGAVDAAEKKKTPADGPNCATFASIMERDTACGVGGREKGKIRSSDSTWIDAGAAILLCSAHGQEP